MLQSRNLDDQRYEEIVREAVGRLPWICPAWTDHNAHDPGITILELMAWFKETIQYEINRTGPETVGKLLALAGMPLRPESAAECLLEVPPQLGARPAFSHLETPEGVSFELDEEIPESRSTLQQVWIKRPAGRGNVDITGMLSGASVFLPFEFGGETGTSLMLDFAGSSGKELRIWFDVEKPDGVERNEPDSDTLPPRTIIWEISGKGEVSPISDGTLSLSHSGFVTLPLPVSAAPSKDRNPTYRVTIRQEEGGCEERVRLTGLSVNRFRAVQTDGRARSYYYTVKPESSCVIQLRSGQAKHTDPAIFLREARGWRQAADYKVQRTKEGLTLRFDSRGAADDGEDNLLVACLDPVRLQDLLFDADGRPGESFRLNLNGMDVLSQNLTLMCQTVCEDGEVRPAIWRCVDDLMVFGPRDKVFVYDRKRETITVGDGDHGAMIAPGENAVMVINELISLCGEGNIPENAGLFFAEDGEKVGNTPAQGGRYTETAAEGRGRLLHRLKDSRKCVSAKDYENQALRTPGLRVAGARALPDYDVRHRHQRVPACVSVAVMPAGDNEKPVPDERFLAAVSRQLDRSRSVCIRTEAIPVRYADIAVSVGLRADKGFQKESAQQELQGFFRPCHERIGEGISRDELSAFLQKLPGVLQIERIELRNLDQNSTKTSGGDISVLPDVVLYLKTASIILEKDRR